MLWFFAVLGGVSLLIMLGMITVVLLFRDRAVLDGLGHSNGWSEFFWLPIDYFSFHLPVWLKGLGRYFSLYILVYLRQGFRFLRGCLLWLEHYFVNLIDLLRGRGSRGGRGSASLFLEQIKEHQDEIRNGGSKA